MLQANTLKSNIFEVWSFRGTYLLCTPEQARQGQYWLKGAMVFSGSPAEIMASKNFRFVASDFER